MLDKYKLGAELIFGFMVALAVFANLPHDLQMIGAGFCLAILAAFGALIVAGPPQMMLNRTAGQMTYRADAILTTYRVKRNWLQRLWDKIRLAGFILMWVFGMAIGDFWKRK